MPRTREDLIFAIIALILFFSCSGFWLYDYVNYDGQLTGMVDDKMIKKERKCNTDDDGQEYCYTVTYHYVWIDGKRYDMPRRIYYGLTVGKVHVIYYRGYYFRSYQKILE